MSVSILIPGPLREYCGGRSTLPSAASTVRDALVELERTQPVLYRNICDETGAVRRHIGVFVNTSHIRDREELDTALVPGDELIFLPAVSGGRPCRSV